MSTVCILQARMNSKRLPGKTMVDICGQPLLAHIIDRLKETQTIDDIIIATTIGSEDTIIASLAKKCGISVFRGAVEDVVKRIYEVIKQWKADIIVHATGDNPLVSPEVTDRLVQYCKSREEYDFIFMPALPIGIGVDVYRKHTIVKLNEKAINHMHREHLNSYLFDNSAEFKIGKLFPEAILRKPHVRLTVDTAEDLRLIQEIYRRLYRPGKIVNIQHVLKLYEDEPELFSVNAQIEQYYVSKIVKKIREM